VAPADSATPSGETPGQLSSSPASRQEKCSAALIEKVPGVEPKWNAGVYLERAPPLIGIDNWETTIALAPHCPATRGSP
jgi:hypothetical protein